MSDHPEEGEARGPRRDPAQPPYSQDVRHSPVTARVPEHVARGGFATATLVLHTNQEFVLDFLATIARPHQLVARVILSPNTFAQTIRALQDNLSKYEAMFGPLAARHPLAGPPPSPPPPAADPMIVSAAPIEPGSTPLGAQTGPPPIDEIYDQLKASEEMFAGRYANVVMMRHSAEEFCFDFIANFYPRSMVTARVYLAAGRVPSLLDAMRASLGKSQGGPGGEGGAAP